MRSLLVSASHRRWLLPFAFGLLSALNVASARAQDALPTAVPAGTRLVVADQNEELQTLMIASGEHARLAASVTYANFIGGPAILEAFRAGALDLATVGNVPPIQAQAAGEEVLIVAARETSEPDYRFALRPGLSLKTLEDFRGRRIAYAEGTGRQAFVLAALKIAGLARRDVSLVPLRSSDMPDAVRSGQVDVAVLNEPHYSRYLADYAGQGQLAMPDDVYDRLPRGRTYLYAAGAALRDPAKTAAIAEFVAHWIAANEWSDASPEKWVKAYFVDRQRLKEADGRAVVESQGRSSFPSLKSQVEYQQGLIDLIHQAGDLPGRLDAAREFDLRFDAVIGSAAGRAAAN